MQTVLPALLLALLVGAAAALMVRDRRQAQRLRLRVQKFYASQLFEDMLPLLKLSRRLPIEQLIVDKTGVIIRYLHHSGGDTAFLMRPNGYRYLTPEQQEALRSVLEECLPRLRDGEMYHLTRRRIRLLNGQVEYAYRYIISNAYKARLSRVAHGDASAAMQPRSW